MEDEWNIDDSETLTAECELCETVRPVQLLPDPFLAELEPEEPNELQWTCKTCFDNRHDEI